MIYERDLGVPKFECVEFAPKKTKYCICIPVINENGRIINELRRAVAHGVHELADIVICDGGSSDGSTDHELLSSLHVNTLLVKLDEGKQGAQLRMGFWWALQRGYEGIITIDGNDKDSIEDVPLFIEKLDAGYDLVQGSRFIRGGKAVNTPLSRYIAVRLVHAPIISATAKRRFTDTTNAYRAYSRKYLTDHRVQPFRDIFMTYELLAYLSVRASQIGLRACEVPVKRAYPKKGKTPTKIKGFHGNKLLLTILLQNKKGAYNP